MPGRALLAVVGLAVLALAPGAAGADVAADEVAASRFTGDGFKALFDSSLLTGLDPIGPPPVITGNADVDARIRAIAESRGYRRRSEATGPLATADGVLLQPDAAAAWTALKAAAGAAGHPLVLRSGYRSEADQRVLFNGKLSDLSDAGIDRRLRSAAAPGYSKHHTGYAADITQAGYSIFSFQSSPGYAWLAADNFANAKRYGWIPSYPDGASNQGPEPEPWELVWVGRTNIVCGDFRPSDGRTFCDTAGRSQLADIEWLYAQQMTVGCRPDRFCIDSPITRAELATMLWRMWCQPDHATATPFVDVASHRFYAPAVRWAWARAVTNGVDPTHFGPGYDITRAEAVTLAWRAVGRPPAETSTTFSDVADDRYFTEAVDWAYEAGVVRGTSATTFEPDRALTRGEAASVLHRLDRTGLVERSACARP